MRFGILSFCLCILCACSVQAQEKPEWFVCGQDSDCVVVGSGCAITAVNIKFQKEADVYFREINSRKDCATLLNSSYFNAACILQKCEDMLKGKIFFHD